VRWPALIVLAVLVAGCPENAIDLERMRRQRKLLPFAPSTAFDDGAAMRPPPEGAVAIDAVIERRPEENPRSITRELLVRGRERFEIVCAACHGLRGDGVSEVAEDMQLRRPPSLLTAPVPGFTDGRIFDVISAGYGLMPAYAPVITVDDRWAIVAYLRALERSQDLALDSLPPALRVEAEARLP
jgi:mono/diheme cytochrome c family protein